MSLTTEQIGEIRTAYREAANPKKQIGILADLYCTTKQEIRKVLGLPKTSKKERRSYGAEEKERRAAMSITEKINEYLERVLRYMDTPWDQRDPKEYEAILAAKAAIYRETGELAAVQPGKGERAL